MNQQQTDAEWEFRILLNIDIGRDDEEPHLAIQDIVLELHHEELNNNNVEISRP